MTTLHDAGQLNVEALWRDFEASLRTFVRRRIADPHRADDVVSEVFLRIHKSLHTLDDDDRIAGWVFTIARNAVTDEHRRAARRREELVADLLDVVDPAALGDDDNPALTELAACIRPLMAYLPEHHRRAVELADLQGVPQTEAAAREGISISGMKSRVQRGRRELRALLVECCTFSLDARGLPYEYVPENDCGCSSAAGCGHSG